MRLIESEPSFDLIPVTLEDDRSIVIEILYNTVVQEASILRNDVEWNIPMRVLYQRRLFTDDMTRPSGRITSGTKLR